MARPNDTVAPTRGNRDEANNDTDQENRRTSIFIDGDEDEERRMVSLEEFLQFVSEKPEWFYEKLCLIHQRYEECLDEHGVHHAERELHGRTKDGEIALLHQKLENVEQQLTEVKSERDVFGSQIARLMMNGINSHQSSPALAPQKTTKIPDPPTLTDGKEPRFEDWLLLMSQKLTANADHFNTPQLRIAYIASRCEGKARKHITPRMRDDAMNPYTNSKDMLDHLKTIYDDPNRVATAKHQFRQLYMKTSDKFHEFLSEFLYLAAEADVAEKDWKDELYTKLTTRLQELCISDRIKNGTFQEFSSAVSQTASFLEVINHRNQKNRSFNFPSTSKDTTKRSSQMNIKKEPTPSRSSSPTASQTSGVGRDRLMKEGRCFHCQEHGHLARDCPVKSSTPELKELEQKPSENELDNNAGKV